MTPELGPSDPTPPLLHHTDGHTDAEHLRSTPDVHGHRTPGNTRYQGLDWTTSATMLSTVKNGLVEEELRVASSTTRMSRMYSPLYDIYSVHDSSSSKVQQWPYIYVIWRGRRGDRSGEWRCRWDWKLERRDKENGRERRHLAEGSSQP
jgi:hypothetical protein